MSHFTGERGAAAVPFQPFFLPAAGGERFCIFHPPAGRARGAFVYVHPFAEEMNKTRRTAALQSRAFAASGHAVLQIDLYGCGDSSGDFRDATWNAWNEDIALAVGWMRRRVDAPLHLWGLRLGASLALDHARQAGGFDGLLLWQPVLSGAVHLTQFLRLRVATGMMGDEERLTTQELRARLAAGQTLEIAGYEVSPALADVIDRVKLAELAPREGGVRWLEIVTEADAGLPAASRKVADAWAARGVDVEADAIAGEPFWATVEIVESRRLVDRTLAAYARVEA